MRNIGIDPQTNFLFKMYYEIGDFKKCEDLLKQCIIRKDRYFHEAQFYLFSLYLKKGRYDLARGVFNDMTTKTKRCKELYERAGHRLEMRENNLYDAIEHCSNVLFLDKKDDKLLLSKAQLLINLGDYNKASSLLTSLNNNNFGVSESNLLYLIMLLEQNDYDAAIEYVKKLLFCTIPKNYIEIIEYLVYIINSETYQLEQEEFLSKFNLTNIEPYYETFNKEIFYEHIKKHICSLPDENTWESKFFSNVNVDEIVSYAQLDKTNLPTISSFNDRTVVDYTEDIGIVAGRSTNDFVFIRKYYDYFPITMYPVVLSDEFDKDGFTRIKY